jgi:predicted secreted Zn-dependent protease
VDKKEIKKERKKEKKKCQEKNDTANLSLQILLEMKSGAIQDVTQEDWGGFIQYVESHE